MFLLLFFFFFPRAAPTACEGSQARDPIGATPQPQQCGIWATSATYTIVHGNTGSSTHWARLGIEPTSSWTLARFINHWAMMGTPHCHSLQRVYLRRVHMYTEDDGITIKICFSDWGSWCLRFQGYSFRYPWASHYIVCFFVFCF